MRFFGDLPASARGFRVKAELRVEGSSGAVGVLAEKGAALGAGLRSRFGSNGIHKSARAGVSFMVQDPSRLQPGCRVWGLGLQGLVALTPKLRPPSDALAQGSSSAPCRTSKQHEL